VSKEIRTMRGGVADSALRAAATPVLASELDSAVPGSVLGPESQPVRGVEKTTDAIRKRSEKSDIWGKKGPSAILATGPSHIT
jgi:hypothetical protein